MSRNLKLSIAVATMLWLAGCDTGYEPNGLLGGYSQIQLNETTYQGRLQGNGYTSDGHCQSKFYTAFRRSGAGWSPTVFAHESPT